MTLLPRLYTVADAAFGDPIHIGKALFDGGAELVQLRDKASGARTLLNELESLLLLASSNRSVIVNDRPDVARLAGAAGVHLGQSDLAPDLARRVLVNGQIIGYSTHNLGQALRADKSPVDYIAVGPIFPTKTKTNPDPVVGLERLREICGQVRKPVVAIGGITLETATRVLECGAASVAVIGDILRHPDVSARTREWVKCVG